MQNAIIEAILAQAPAVFYDSAQRNMSGLLLNLGSASDANGAPSGPTSNVRGPKAKTHAMSLLESSFIETVDLTAFADLSLGYTALCWLKPIALEVPDARIISVGHGKEDNEIALSRYASTQRLQLRQWNGVNPVAGSLIAPTDDLVLDQWLFVAVTISGVSVLMYLNNAPAIASTAGEGPQSQPRETLVIGAAPDGSDVGAWEIAYPAVFARALTAQQISSIYTARKRIPGTVSIDGVPTARLIRAFARDDGEFLGQAISSDVTGAWEITSVHPGAVDVICVDEYGDRWYPNTDYDLNTLMIPTNPNGHYYKVTVAGLSGGAEPSWPVNGGTVINGGMTVQDMGEMQAPLIESTFVPI